MAIAPVLIAAIAVGIATHRRRFLAPLAIASAVGILTALPLTFDRAQGIRNLFHLATCHGGPTLGVTEALGQLSASLTRLGTDTNSVIAEFDPRWPWIGAGLILCSVLTIVLARPPQQRLQAMWATTSLVIAVAAVSRLPAGLGQTSVATRSPRRCCGGWESP